MAVETVKSGIYLIVNCVNDKFYIGSAVDLRRRQLKHFRYLDREIHPNLFLQNAYNKYGAENFGFSVLEYVDDINNLIAREQFWLDYTKCYEREVGYNICKIADNRTGILHTEETKARMSNSRKGIIKSPEWLANISAGLKGLKRTEEVKKQMSLARKGKTIPEERKLRISASHIGKKHSEESKQKRSEKLKGRKVGGFKEGEYRHSEETKRKLSEARKKYLSSKINIIEPPLCL